MATLTTSADYVGEHTNVTARATTLYTLLCLVQGVYYLATGIWPLVSIETFQQVTGFKTDHLVTGREADHWLVNTVAVLVIAVGLVLCYASWHRRPAAEVWLLAVASAIGLTAIDVIYVQRQTILPIYLADAAAEVVLIVAWVWCAARGMRRKPTLSHGWA